MVLVASLAGGGVAVGSPTVSSSFTLADDARVVRWLRRGTPGFPAVRVPDLVFELGAFDAGRGGAPLHVEAPSPAPSPFTIDEIGRQHPGPLAVRGGYWAEARRGTVKLAFSSDDLTTGDANGVVHAPPGSEMATLFGATQRSYIPGYSLLAAEHWDHATYRKGLYAHGRTAS